MQHFLDLVRRWKIAFSPSKQDQKVLRGFEPRSLDSGSECWPLHHRTKVVELFKFGDSNSKPGARLAASSPPGLNIWTFVGGDPAPRPCRNNGGGGCGRNPGWTRTGALLLPGPVSQPLGYECAHVLVMSCHVTLPKKTPHPTHPSPRAFRTRGGCNAALPYALLVIF